LRIVANVAKIRNLDGHQTTYFQQLHIGTVIAITEVCDDRWTAGEEESPGAEHAEELSYDAGDRMANPLPLIRTERALQRIRSDQFGAVNAVTGPDLTQEFGRRAKLFEPGRLVLVPREDRC